MKHDIVTPKFAGGFVNIKQNNNYNNFIIEFDDGYILHKVYYDNSSRLSFILGEYTEDGNSDENAIVYSRPYSNITYWTRFGLETKEKSVFLEAIMKLSKNFTEFILFNINML